MKNTKSMAGMLLAAAALAVVSIPTEALAKKDPFGYAANQPAVNMWLQQKGAAAYNNGYYTAPYNFTYGYTSYAPVLVACSSNCSNGERVSYSFRMEKSPGASQVISFIFNDKYWRCRLSLSMTLEVAGNSEADLFVVKAHSMRLWD